MSTTDAAAELRMLRAKAYGPLGGLSEQELARLRELEGWNTPAAVDPVPEPDDAVPEPDASIVEPDASIVEPDTSISEPVEVPRRLRRWPLVVGTAAALLAVGLGVGWGIWGWDREASALAAAHGETRSELEAEQDYDPGTVVPLAADHGVVVWTASRSDGDELCVIVTSPPSPPQTDCVTAERMDNYAWPSTMVTVPEGEDAAGQQLSASLIRQADGEFVPFIQVWGEDSNWELHYSEAELAQLRAIEAMGYQGEMLQILGADGDRIVWSSWETGTLCVVAPAGDDRFTEACAGGPNEDLVLGAEVDGVPTRYVITQSEMRSPQLTVYKDVDTDYYFGE